MPESAIPPVTGHDQVDAALAGLRDLDSRPVAAQLQALGAAHEQLHRALDLEQNH